MAIDTGPEVRLPPDVHVKPAPTRKRRGLVQRLSFGHVIMILSGLVAFLATASFLRTQSDSVRVAIAAEEIPAGTFVTLESFEFTDIHAGDDILAGLLLADNAPEYEGWIAASTLAPGEVLRVSDLRAPSAPEEQRAMSIPIEPDHAVAGALAVGDRVDVIVVRDAIATYLLKGAEVLEVSTPDRSGGLGVGGRSSFSITVAVDDESALRLASAIRSGEIEIVRSTGAPEVTTDTYDPGAEASPQSPPVSQPPARRTSPKRR